MFIGYLSLVVSVAALALSIIQFFRDSSREKKEATLTAYNELQNDVFSKLILYKTPMPPIDIEDKAWSEITDCLARLERFSTGINTGIYSIEILNRLGGEFFIHQYDQLSGIIEKKRKQSIVGGDHYNEFELTVESLKKLRNNTSKN